MGGKLTANYVYVNGVAGGRVHRTASLSDDLMVDLDESGRIFGIERLGGPVDMATLFAVAKWVGTGS